MTRRSYAICYREIVEDIAAWLAGSRSGAFAEPRPGPHPGTCCLADHRLPPERIRPRGAAPIGRLFGGLCCAVMMTGTALRHTRIGDPVLF